MERNDLGVDYRPRVTLVTLDVLTAGRPLPQKRLWQSWETVAEKTYLDHGANGRLWQMLLRGFASKFDCVAFGVTDAYADALQKRFDSEGFLFAHTDIYVDRHALQRDLAFRIDVVRVIDVNALHWGSRGATLEEAVNG